MTCVRGRRRKSLFCDACSGLVTSSTTRKVTSTSQLSVALLEHPLDVGKLLLRVDAHCFVDVELWSG